MNLTERVFEISSDREFEQIALELFEFQYSRNTVYRSFADGLKMNHPKTLEEIPFLPISFFKSHRIILDGLKEEVIFKSSGTGGERSAHFVHSTQLYEKSFVNAFRQFFGDPEELVILALLPNYLEQGESSLVYMVDQLIRLTKDENSGFYLNDLHQLIRHIASIKSTGKRIILFGVSYALLDLAALSPDLNGVTVIETGGMKGRRKEMTKSDLHETLRKGLGVESIYSEYGMTELLSQAYSTGELLFNTPSWMRILIRDTNDPLTYLENGKTGGINVIDLTNIYSCSFIATQDLGKSFSNGQFEVLGRFDMADIRGCNLLVQ